MKKLEFNNLDLILDFIKNSENKDALLLIEMAVKEARKGSFTNFKVGDHVIFGRTNGRKRPGVIIKTNPARAVIKDTNLGGTWRVPYSLMEAA
jgi:hypothetical protein